MIGILFALGSAAFWAIATRLFKGMANFWSAAALALIKSVVSLILFALWFIVSGESLLNQQTQTIVWLVISGVIGIGLGDTALFIALYRMGERQTLLIAETASPILVLIAAFLLLYEQIEWLQLVGVLLVILGVDCVIGLRKGSAHFDTVGVSWALLAALCQTFGVLVSRLYLTETDISAQATAFWRISGACLVLPIWLMFRRESILPSKVPSTGVYLRLMTGIILGTFFGILFLQIAIDLLPAALAQTLIATSILFAVVIAFFAGEKIELRQWIGVIIAVAGVALISLRLIM